LKEPRAWHIPEKLVLYTDEGTQGLDVGEIAAHLREVLAISTETKRDFFREYGRRDLQGIAEKIAGTRVRNFDRPFETEDASYGEIAFELRFLEDPARKVPGVLYDGMRFEKLLRGLLPGRMRIAKVQHIVFTSRMIGTFEKDGRYHAHVNLCGYPSLISTSGVVEAPAKPREYYVLKQQFIQAGGAVPFELLKERFSGQFIDYDDPRMTEVLKGYVLQCAVYSIAGEPFCRNRRCRLFDAHWQSELIEAQLHGDRFCEKHREMLTAIRRASGS
jgi:hypothetical protein